MEEQEVAVNTSVEETDSPSASEEETTSEVESTEADTLDQPTEEAELPAPKSRAQERIARLAKEKNYWQNLYLERERQAPAPSQSDGYGDDNGMDTADIVADRVAARIRAEQAREAMIEDAQITTEAFPILNTDDKLARRVLAIAQAEGRSMYEVANELVPQTQAVRKSAEAKLKAEGSIAAGTKVSSGKTEPLDIKKMSSDQLARNWEAILEQHAAEM